MRNEKQWSRMKNWITISNDFIIEEIEWIRRDSVIDFEKIGIIVVDDYDSRDNVGSEKYFWEE